MAEKPLNRISLKVRCVEGVVYETSVTEVTDEQYQQFEELVRNFKKLNYLTVENLFGDEVHVNPDKIIAVEVLKHRGF